MDTVSIKTKLENELKQLEKELSSVGKLDATKKDWVPRPDKLNVDAADRNEVADIMESYEGNTAILADLEIRYNEITAALARIAAGTFGICTVCGNDIEADRLEANPAATTCKAHLS